MQKNKIRYKITHFKRGRPGEWIPAVIASHTDGMWLFSEQICLNLKPHSGGRGSSNSQKEHKHKKQHYERKSVQK